MDIPVILLVPEDGSRAVEIGIFYRGRLESEPDGYIFHELLTQNSDSASSTALTPSQIKSLNRVLDLAGFNQYSYPMELSGYAADFFLRTAQVKVLNGRSLLKVDGEFRADMNPDSYYVSYFVDADNRGRKIYEIFMLGKDKESYLLTLPLFKDLMESIQWQTMDKQTLS